MADISTPGLPEAEKAIRAVQEALDAGPTPGPWFLTSESETVHGYSAEGEALIVVYELGTNEADHALVAACNPEAMTVLLSLLASKDAEIERLRADAERYRWIKSDEGAEFRIIQMGAAGYLYDEKIDAAIAAQGGGAR